MTEPSRHLAVEAATRTAELVADPAVARRWGEESVLPGYRVGGLAAHLTRAVETVRGYLEAEAPAAEVPLVDAVEYYRVVLGAHDPRESQFHREVRERGERRVDAGHPALVADIRDAAGWLSSQSLDLDRPVSVFAGTAMRLGDYLDTRLAEMLVHGHDLALSVGVPAPPYAGDAWSVVARMLAQTTAARHGPQGLALALARPELAIGAFTAPVAP